MRKPGQERCRAVNVAVGRCERVQGHVGDHRATVCRLDNGVHNVDHYEDWPRATLSDKTKAAPILSVIAAAALLCWQMAAPAPAQAVPGQCGGGGFIGFGSFCDSDGWPDGSFWHCVSGGGPFAWGSNCNRVCDSPRGNPMPPITDNDPNTRCPGW